MYIMYVPVCIFIIVYFYLGEASGKPFARVPYLRGGFEVTGLPDGIPFKKPTAYGTKTIQELMKNAEKIQFKIAEKQVGFTSSRQELITAKQTAYYRVLGKIIDSDKIPGCLSRDVLITEQDLEVSNLDLLASEFHVLVTDLNDHFEKDAMISLIANYQSGLTHKGYHLPVYTDTEEPYWLFYHPGSSSEIEKLLPEDRIWGYWLDKTSTKMEYKLLLSNEKACITALNVVCCDGELGSLRLKQNISVCDGATIVVPVDFDSSILTCLDEQGFL